MPAKTNLNLTREQLALFLPNHEAIKAFEKLMLMVSEDLPISENDLAAIVAGIPRVNVESIRQAVASLEAMQVQSPNLDPLSKRLETLEQQPDKRPNLTAVETRLAAIEAYLGI